MSLLTAPIVENSHNYFGIYFIFLKERSRQNLKAFYDHISSSLKRPEKMLLSKRHFSIFLQIRRSNFSYNCVKRLKIIKIIRKVKFKEVWGEIEAKNNFQI